MRRVSVDIGGTFTDCFLVFDDCYVETKALTTHHNLGMGFMEALQKACDAIEKDIRGVLSEVDAVRYATTLGTNALIERKGPPIGLLVTAGFESSIVLGRGRGYGEGLSAQEQVDLPAATRPVSLVSSGAVVGIRERIDYKGEVVSPLDPEDVRARVLELVDKGVRAFVVSLVNSVVNPSHERLIEEIILEEYPTHLLGAIPTILSHRVAERKSEYARTMSAILDAYLHDQMYHGLSMLEVVLRQNGYRRPMLVVHNTGGMAQLNSTHALQTIHSGPVAGLAATEHLSEQYDEPNVIATDMGGTSFDIGLVTGQGVKFYEFNPVIDRWLVSAPMTYLHTLGAGGGSIARYERLWDAVEVGPESAGSDPGPACYGRGGSRPTVTDANLVLGYLDAENYAGGSIKLSRRRAERALREHVCEHTSMSLVEAALAVRRKVNANMASAIFKEVAVKGYDPRRFTLLAYGGGGPMHACGYAEKIGISHILIPPFASVFSALGAGNMPQLHIHERSLYLNLYDAVHRELLKDFERFNAVVEELEAAGHEDLIRQGARPEEIETRVELDMRYGNQLAQTAVVSPLKRLRSLEDVFRLIDVFSEQYESRFGSGSKAPEAGIRINVLRVLSFVEHRKVPLRRTRGGSEGQPRPRAHRDCHFEGAPRAVSTPVFYLDDLSEGAEIRGPAVVETPRTTYLAEPDWLLRVGSQGSAELWRVA